MYVPDAILPLLKIVWSTAVKVPSGFSLMYSALLVAWRYVPTADVLDVLAPQPMQTRASVSRSKDVTQHRVTGFLITGTH